MRMIALAETRKQASRARRFSPPPLLPFPFFVLSPCSAILPLVSRRGRAPTWSLSGALSWGERSECLETGDEGSASRERLQSLLFSLSSLPPFAAHKAIVRHAFLPSFLACLPLSLCHAVSRVKEAPFGGNERPDA